MPLPVAILQNMRKQLDSAKAQLADLEITLANLRRSGINAADQDTRVKELKEQIRKLEALYNAEAARK